MGKTYTGSTGNKYAVMSWPVASIREHRQITKYKVSVRIGKEWQRYPKAAYYDTPEEAERELEVLAKRRGWICEK